MKSLLEEIKEYLRNNLKLEIKPNYQIFPVYSRGIDFVGYKHYHTHTLLRKSIKKKFIKMVKANKNEKSIASYNGWISHANGVNLWDKYINNKENDNNKEIRVSETI